MIYTLITSKNVVLTKKITEKDRNFFFSLIFLLYKTDGGVLVLVKLMKALINEQLLLAIIVSEENIVLYYIHF